MDAAFLHVAQALADSFHSFKSVQTLHHVLVRAGILNHEFSFTVDRTSISKDASGYVAHALLRAAPTLVSALSGPGTRVETSLDPAR